LQYLRKANNKAAASIALAAAYNIKPLSIRSAALSRRFNDRLSDQNKPKRREDSAQQEQYRQRYNYRYLAQGLELLHHYAPLSANQAQLRLPSRKLSARSARDRSCKTSFLISV